MLCSAIVQPAISLVHYIHSVICTYKKLSSSHPFGQLTQYKKFTSEAVFSPSPLKKQKNTEVSYTLVAQSWTRIISAHRATNGDTTKTLSNQGPSSDGNQQVTHYSG